MVAALALAVAATYGAGLGPDGEAPDRSGAALSQSVAGAVLLVGLACVGWWALLRLARGRGLAFTAVVVGWVLVEIGVRIFWWAGEPWLPSTNAAALVTPDGAVLEMYEGWGLVGTGEVTFVRVGQLRAAAVLVAIGTWLFARRDIH